MSHEQWTKIRTNINHANWKLSKFVASSFVSNIKIAAYSHQKRNTFAEQWKKNIINMRRGDSSKSVRWDLALFCPLKILKKNFLNVCSRKMLVNATYYSGCLFVFYFMFTHKIKVIINKHQNRRSPYGGVNQDRILFFHCYLFLVDQCLHRAKLRITESMNLTGNFHYFIIIICLFIAQR